MKKILLLAMTALVFSGANAQLRKDVTTFAKSNLKDVKKTCVMESAIDNVVEMKQATPAEIASAKLAPKKAQKRAGYIENYYERPAGAFFCPFIASDGAGLYNYGNLRFILTKPFGDYTWRGKAYGDDGSYTYVWEYYVRDAQHFTIGEKDLTYNDFFWMDPAPIFHMVEGDPYSEDSKWWDFQLTQREMDGDDDNFTVKAEEPVYVASATNDEMLLSMFSDDEGVDFLLTSKTMVEGGRFGNSTAYITSFRGADPYGNNQYGWWFGKNGSHIDGMAQIFEKPSHPYMLKNVYLQANPDMKVNGNVKMTCKVYKLESVPEYVDGGGVSLPVEPGELIVTGEALVTPTTGESKNGLITFTLYGFDEDDPELTYEYTPTIDYPIMICIDGYNDPEMADLEDFRAYVGEDWNEDEGYGELAYLKYPIYEIEYDENGDTIWEENGDPRIKFTGEYYWRGLNNFFQGPMEMKTGLTIFITIDNPYIDYYYSEFETGEYTFPDEGGSFHKTYEYVDTLGNPDPVEADVLAFFCCYPYEDGDWSITYNGIEELPEWLHMELADVQTYATGTIVVADVTADPLPEGVKYREAEIRFEIPGDFKVYKFKQGEPQPGLRGDVNGDGEVNIADINALIDMILAGNAASNGDVNGDGEVNIADINAVIDIILNS
jgi:hypothetical protein